MYLFNPLIKNNFQLVSKIANKIGSTYFVTKLSDLPTPVSNVITISSGESIFLLNDLDLQGNRLYFEEDCALKGLSSETTSLWSSLNTGEALITATGSLPIQNIALAVYPSVIGQQPVVFDLDGINEPGAALDWFAVNVVGTENIGHVRNYANFVVTLCAFIGTTNGFYFSGTFDSIVFSDSIFRNTLTNGVLLDFDGATIINRRIRIVDCPFIVPSGTIGIRLPDTVSIGIESYILRFLNFTGAGTYIDGITVNDNRALFIGNKGLNFKNTAAKGLFYFRNNITATVINTVDVFVKVNIPYLFKNLDKFSLSSNDIVSESAISNSYKISLSVSFNGDNNRAFEFRIAKNNDVTNSLGFISTAKGTLLTERVENVSGIDVFDLNQNDTLSVWVRNISNSSNIVITDLVLLVESLNN